MRTFSRSYTRLLTLIAILARQPLSLSLPTSVFISSNTPLHLVTSLSILASAPQSSISMFTLNAASDVSGIKSSVVVDMLYSEYLSRCLRDLALNDQEVINGNEYSLENEEKLFTSKVKEANGLLAVARWAKLSRVCVLLDEKRTGIEEMWQEEKGMDITYLVISEDVDTLSLTSLLNKLIKPQGFNSFLVLLSNASAQRVFSIMDKLHMGQTSLNLFLSLSCLHTARGAPLGFPRFVSTGPVFLIDSGCELTTTELEFLQCKLTQAGYRNVSGSVSIMNFVNEARVNIGSISGQEVNVTTSWTKSSSPTISDKPTLTIAMNNGTLNPSGEAGTYEDYSYKGAILAFADVNKDSLLLPYHNLRMLPLSLGLYEFNMTWARKQLENTTREDLGLAMVAGQYSGVTIGVYSLMMALNYSITITGASTTSPRLSSPKVYPMFTRVIMSDAYMSVLYVRMLKHYGWTHVAVLHCDDVWCQGLYDLFVEKCSEEGITIVNDEKLRMIPVDVDRNSTDYDAAFQHIVDSKVRILLSILYGNALYKSFDGLYDLGMRAGDIVLLAIEWLNVALFDTDDPPLVVKMKELCRGAIQFFPVDFVGNYGVNVKERYISMFDIQPSTYACFNYDAVMLIAYALDYLITYGGDYESPDEINKQLRSTRFKGCTGIVTIAEGTNDRAPIMYGILNAQISADGNVSMARVGTYDPAGLVLFNFTEAIIWPDNTTNVPTDIRVNDIDCPFASKEIVTYVPGVVVAYLSLLLMCVVAVAITIVIWRKWWGLRAVKLTVRAEISFDDYILFATIGLEAFQYAAMGPDFPSWIQVLAEVGNALSVNLEKMIKLSNGMYWLVLDGVFAGVALWTFFLIVVFFHLDFKLEFLCSKVGDLAEKLLPILGNLCFLPIISTLMNVFQCTEAVDHPGSLGFTDTFLKQDCYQMCWTAPHLPYAIGSVIALFVYLPPAVFLRPAWQNMQPYLHVFANPAYLMLKTIYQLIIIVLNKTLKQSHTLSHSFLFLVVTSGFFVFTVKWRPYGYARPNLWHFASLACVLWLSVLTILDTMISAVLSTIWVAVFLIGIALICGFSVVWQTVKLEAILYRKPGIHVMALFRFMFSRGNKYLYIFNSPRSGHTQADSDRQVKETPRLPPSVATFSPRVAPM